MPSNLFTSTTIQRMHVVMYLVNLMAMQYPTAENLARVSRFICLVGVLQDSAWLLIM